MARGPLDALIRHLRAAVAPLPGAGPSDAELLRRFAADRDEAAFAALVSRHGTMVLGVCRRVLRHAQDAEDAFQATFLVRARKAGGLGWRDSVAGWLYAVAWRVACKARAAAARRRARYTELSEEPATEGLDEGPGRDVERVLDEEMNRLPEKYRVPLVLCHLEGKSCAEAAQILGRRVGTLWSLLSRGRDLLRARLTRRGVALSGAALVEVLEGPAAASAAPAALLTSTAQVAAGCADLGARTASVFALVKGALRDMSLLRMKLALAALVVLAAAGLAVAVMHHTPPPERSQATGPENATPNNARPAGKPKVPAVVKGNNTFAFDLYGRLRTEKGNVFFSPYSISTALAMTYAGARGETEQEMARTLHFSLSQETLHPSFHKLMEELNGGKERPYELVTANALWGQKGYAFLPDFTGLVKDHYDGGLRQVDFVTATEPARLAINQWVSKETHDRIKDLIPKGILTDMTRLVLTNAIYFKARWQRTFDENATRDADFFTGQDTKVRVKMMSQDSRFPYLKGQGFQALELPYRDKELSMVVLLPTTKDGLADFEKGLTAENVNTWLSRLRAQRLQVFLPRFKVTGEFDLSKKLQEMGMARAFKPRRANFSGMDGTKNLFVQAVVHKAFVDVNEQGTEAAGATAVVINDVSLPPQFRADHPFVFLIRHRATGSILFVGRLSDPT